MKLTESMVEGPKAAIRDLFFEEFFRPLFDVLDEAEPKLNEAGTSRLIVALRSGRVTYESGTFTGKFSAAISRELAEFATFDSRSGKWYGKPPPPVLGAALVANDKREALIKKLDYATTKMWQTEKRLDGSQLRIGKTLEEMNDAQMEALEVLGIKPKISRRMDERIAKDYVAAQNRNIKEWAPDQIERLRAMVKKVQLEKPSKEGLRDIIMREWGTTDAKATFLAKQETSLLLSKYRREHFMDAGVTKYKWSCSMDQRSRPMHKALHGKVFAFGDPPITDEKGNRNEPGEDFGCRCVAIPIVPGMD